MSDTGRRRRNPLRPHVVAGSLPPAEPSRPPGSAPDESAVAPETFEQEPFGWFREEPGETSSTTPATAGGARAVAGEPVAGVPAVSPLAHGAEAVTVARSAEADAVLEEAGGEAEAAEVVELGPEAGGEAEAAEVVEVAEEEAELPVAVDATTISVAAAPPAAPAVAAAPRRGSAAARLRTLVVSVLVVALTAVLGFAAGTMLPTLLPGPGIAGGPTASPTAALTPTPEPIEEPTVAPTPTPTVEPTEEPTVAPTPTPTPKPIVHVVKPGENLTMIAAKYGVTVKAIQDANGIKDPNKIIVGQKLKIPPKP